ncbi:MAG TPA: ATP-binding cassette domain-containing protein [Solirubrobacteraceae bacterium]|nr:ATP-binding cassette domain-containing protein [Solirubrobacteraceae bacterium]
MSVTAQTNRGTLPDPGSGLLEVTDLSVAFGGVRALSELSLALEPGEVVGVVGPNGSGKSTMLNAVGGLLKGAEVSGHISVVGVSGRRRAAALARAGLARSFQDPKLLEDLTLLDNLMCGAHHTLSGGSLVSLVRSRAARGRRHETERWALELLHTVKLDGEAWDVVAGKPYATRKLTDLLRAFVCRPRLVLLDEPTSGLDGHDRSVVSQFLGGMRERATTSMVIVEHHFELLREVADRVIALGAGRLILSGPPHEVLDSEEFRGALTGTAAAAEAD